MHDAAIKWLAGHHHPQQRRQLLHSHQRKLKEFIEDSCAQWDNEHYTTSRYNQARPFDTIFATPEIQQNIQAAQPEDGGNVPLNTSKFSLDKLSINELQLHLSNQAAVLRMQMANEYEDLRICQNHELETIIKAKANQDHEFAILVQEMQNSWNRLQQKQPQQSRNPRQRRDSSYTIQSPHSPIQSTTSPIQFSPSDILDINTLKNDASILEFARFFLHLQVVEENWFGIYRSWFHYVSQLQRNLMTESAFAKAILQAAVHTKNKAKFRVQMEPILETRTASKQVPEAMHISHIIIQVLLEMAEAGDVEFTKEASESKGEAFGPKILLDVMNLEARMKLEKSTMSGR
jgi:hypothetical protein